MQKIPAFLLITIVTLASSVPSWAAQKTQASCFVAHFKSLALKTHHPQLRATAAEDWLKKNVLACTSAQLSALQSNSPTWLGTAMTMEISSILEGAIEAQISGNPGLMAKLYESAGKEGVSSTVTHTNPTPRAPVVQAMAVNGGLAGSANFGTIAGDTTLNKTTNNLTSANANTNANANANTNTNVNNSPNTTVR
jgi:hypothetical protein